MTKYCFVDPGKNEVKLMLCEATGELINAISFPSKVDRFSPHSILVEEFSPNHYHVEFDGENYHVGEGVNRNYNTELTKANLHHQVCIYTAVASVIKEKDEVVELVLGLPANDYANKELCHAYAQLVKDNYNGRIKIKLNGKNKSFQINSVTVFPEGQAILPRLWDETNSLRTYTIDIGGQNVNFHEYDQKGNIQSSFSLNNAGVNYLARTLEAELRKRVNQSTYNFNNIDYMEVIKTKKFPVQVDIDGYENQREFVIDVVHNFIQRRIFEDLAMLGYNILGKGQRMIFTGGGSSLLEDDIGTLLEHNKDDVVFSKTAKWDNCLSFVVQIFQERFRDTQLFLEALMTLYERVLREDFEEDLTEHA